MEEAAARAELEQLVAHDQDPTLSIAEVDVLLDRARRPDAAGNGPQNTPLTAGVWAAATGVLVGAVVLVGVRYWRVVVPGTTGTVAPNWPQLAGGGLTCTQVVDGYVTWEDAGTTWSPTFDLEAAAARGWMLKAGKAAGQFAFGEDGQQFSREQITAHCQAMAATFRQGSATTLQV